MPGERASRARRLRAALGALLERAHRVVVGPDEGTRLAHAQSEMRWDGAVERFGGALALFDADRRAVRVNRTLIAWLRRSEEEIVGRRCDELFLRACATQPCSHALA